MTTAFLLLALVGASDWVVTDVGEPAAFTWAVTDIAPVEAQSERPVVDVLVADGDWCAPCNWWKKRGDAGLPVRLNFIPTSETPRFGFPTFRVQDKGKTWYIANSACSDDGVQQVMNTWRSIVGPQGDADAGTPPDAVRKAIEIAQAKGKRFADLGCGDGRLLIAAVLDGANSAIGIEIDPQKADAARANVAAAGLSDKIEIITGDATTTAFDADVVFMYLFPDTLEALRPKLTGKRVISYQHAVPGLQGTQQGEFWIYADQPARASGGRPYAIYQGRKYYAPTCNSGRCGMCQNIRWQISTRQHVE